MNRDDLKEGIKIRICQKPSISIKEYGGAAAKRKMAGKTKTIRSILKKRDAVMVKDNMGNYWTIHFDDIRRLESLPLIKPVIFDPDQLVMD